MRLSCERVPAQPGSARALHRKARDESDRQLLPLVIRHSTPVVRIAPPPAASRVKSRVPRYTVRSNVALVPVVA